MVGKNNDEIDDRCVEGGEDEEEEKGKRQLRKKAYIRWRKSVCLILLLPR